MSRFIPKQQQLVWLFLFSTFLLLIWAGLKSEGAYGGADSFVHYLIARYSWQNPALFLDHWGKPVFTLLASPFAQFGFIGIRVFNILCALFSAHMAAELAKKQGLQFFGVASVFSLTAVLAIPVYLSGLTEPLFALVLITAMYLFSAKKWIFSAVLISFIPLVRTEGFMFIPLWAVVLIFSNKIKTIPFLATGLLVYSLIGVLVGKDIGWIISESPYGVGKLYGSGELLHFWNFRDATFGSVYILTFFLGLGWMLSQWQLFKVNTNNRNSWILILGSFFGYFLAHSLVWWLGRGSSAGLTRVMIGVVPVGAVVCAAAFQLVTFMPKRSLMAFLFTCIGAYMQLKATLPGHSNLAVPSKWGVEEVVLQETVNYLINNELHKEYIVYYNPVVAFMMSLNPFSTASSREKVVDPNHPEKGLKNGTIIVYDNHFAPAEGMLPQKRLVDSSYFILLKKFTTTADHFMSNGERYSVFIYQKVGSSN